MPRAIVIGAARRVGRAVAIEFARAGFDIDLTCLSARAEADAAARECEGLGVRASVHRLDLAEPATWSEALDAFGDGPVDALAVVASSYAATPWGSITVADAEHEMRVNAIGPLLLVQSLADRLSRSRRPGGGAVVLFGDIHADGRPRRARAPYLMSKAAIHAMTEALAVEMAPAVRVNAIAPGVVAWPDDAPDAERRTYESRIPLGRPGTPVDAARLAVALCRDLTYVTGTVVRLDGGRWLR